jgi:hypothetical protein
LCDDGSSSEGRVRNLVSYQIAIMPQLPT